MGRVRHNFKKVSISRYIHGICPVCGKPANRQKTFWQTLNPLNTTLDGTIKTIAMIREELMLEADKWVINKEVIHARCEKQ